MAKRKQSEGKRSAFDKESVIKEDVMTLNEYLAKYNRERVLDNILRKWYFKKCQSNPAKTKREWDVIIKSFFNETER